MLKKIDKWYLYPNDTFLYANILGNIRMDSTVLVFQGKPNPTKLVHIHEALPRKWLILLCTEYVVSIPLKKTSKKRIIVHHDDLSVQTPCFNEGENKEF